MLEASDKVALILRFITANKFHHLVSEFFVSFIILITADFLVFILSTVPFFNGFDSFFYSSRHFFKFAIVFLIGTCCSHSALTLSRKVIQVSVTFFVWSSARQSVELNSTLIAA